MKEKQTWALDCRVQDGKAQDIIVGLKYVTGQYGTLFNLDVRVNSLTTSTVSKINVASFLRPYSFLVPPRKHFRGDRTLIWHIFLPNRMIFCKDILNSEKSAPF